MSLRTLIFWTHLTLAVTIGSVVVLLAATGVLLAYQPQITRWADLRAHDGGAPAAASRRLPPDTLVARARAVAGSAITGLRVRANADVPVEVLVGRERTLFLNAYTGEVLGSGSAGARRFFATVTALHRWLALEGDARRAGRAVTGVANVAFLLLVLTGLVLWVPRSFTRTQLRNVLLFRRGLRAKARDFNWHHVTGIWAALPLLLIIASGAVISYAWAGALAERISAGGTTAPPPSTVADTLETALPTAALFAIAERKVHDWRSITLRLPQRGGASTFIIERGGEGQPQKRGELTLSRGGTELRWLTFADEPRPRRVRSVLRYLHTGEVLGPAGQTVAAAASAAVLLLAWTGLALALRRLRSWRARRTPR